MREKGSEGLCQDARASYPSCGVRSEEKKKQLGASFYLRIVLFLSPLLSISFVLAVSLFALLALLLLLIGGVGDWFNLLLRYIYTIAPAQHHPTIPLLPPPLPCSPSPSPSLKQPLTTDSPPLTPGIDANAQSVPSCS